MIVTAADREALDRDGIAVFRNVVSARLVLRAIDAICEFGGFALDDESTWYRNHPENDGIVPLHHAQAFWDIRQHPALHDVFSEIWGTHRLMVNMNRCCFRPPQNPLQPDVSKGNIHWDIDPRAGDPGWLQGVVYLSDVGRSAGGFQCAPSIYRTLDTWLDEQGNDFDFDQPTIPDDCIEPVEGQAGDLIVWRPLLPHGPAPNTSDQPRIACAVKMDPWPPNDGLRDQTVSWWREKRAPPWWRGLPGQVDPEPGPPARLTRLGRRLVGLDAWD